MDRASAIFLDARTRRDTEVRAELAAGLLRIISLNGKTITEWPLDQLQMVDRGDNSDRFVIGHVGNDISRLTLFDQELRMALFKASPTLKASLREGRLRRFFIWMGWLTREQ